MSRIVLVCSRQPRNLRPALEHFLTRLCPDNLAPEHVVTHDGRGLYVGIYRPLAPLTDRGFTVGWLRSAGDGSYASFRGGDTVEIATDAVASRSVWVALTDELFIASTSQRAIPYFLGSFELDRRAVAWMLSAGCTGPGIAWDARARPLGPQARASFDRRAWRLAITEGDTELRPERASVAGHRKRVAAAIDHACTGSFDGFTLCLSGGRDSRNILQRIERTADLEAVTWGLPEAFDDELSDAAIARRVARHYGIGHRYLSTAAPTEPAEKVLARFVHCGEGRVDHLSAYADGFALWKQLAESGIRGIIRGDNLFGVSAARTYAEAKAEAGLLTLSSLAKTLPLDDLGLDHLVTTVPSKLEPHAGERPHDYYHRLMHAFRHPTVIAALNDLKAAYVEIANPLNIDSCVAVARSLPSKQRDYKRLLNSLADRTIPFARTSAVGSSDGTLAPFIELLADELLSAPTAEHYSRALGAFLADRVARPAAAAWRPRPRPIRAFAVFVPQHLRWRTGARRKPPLSARRLALRVYLVNATVAMMQRDATAIAKVVPTADTILESVALGFERALSQVAAQPDAAFTEPRPIP